MRRNRRLPLALLGLLLLLLTVTAWDERARPGSFAGTWRSPDLAHAVVLDIAVEKVRVLDAQGTARPFRVERLPGHLLLHFADGERVRLFLLNHQLLEWRSESHGHTYWFNRELPVAAP